MFKKIFLFYFLIIFIFIIIIGLLFEIRLKRIWYNMKYLTIDQVTQETPHNKSRSIKMVIPRLIHQTWINNIVPDRWNRTVQSVIELNVKDFEYHLWTDKTIDLFLKFHYSLFYKSTFVNYRFPIQKVDAFRYFLLYHYGGIYIDMDYGCSKPLIELIRILERVNTNDIAAFPETNPVGVTNGFMISTIRHPLFGQMIEALPFWNINFIINYFTVMLSTGPSFLTIQNYLYAKDDGNLWIIKDNVYSRNSPYSFTWRTRGSTWHGSDATLILFIYNHFTIILTTIILFIFVLKMHRLYMVQIMFKYVFSTLKRH